MEVIVVIGVICGVLGVGVVEVVRGILWIILKIWPDRRNWIATFGHNGHEIELPETLSTDERKKWISPEPQTVGDTYKIDLGKYRVIDGIEFHEKSPTNEFPYKWGIYLLGEWGDLVDRPIMGEGRIIREFPATKIHGIEIVISEPRKKDDGTAYNWRIERVYLREIKFKLLCSFRGKI
jgi:hypothetical protein